MTTPEDEGADGHATVPQHRKRHAQQSAEDGHCAMLHRAVSTGSNATVGIDAGPAAGRYVDSVALIAEDQSQPFHRKSRHRCPVLCLLRLTIPLPVLRFVPLLAVRERRARHVVHTWKSKKSTFRRCHWGVPLFAWPYHVFVFEFSINLLTFFILYIILLFMQLILYYFNTYFILI